MNTIQKYARLLKFLIMFVGIPFFLGSFIFKWLWNSVFVFNSIKDCALASANLTHSPVNHIPSVILRVVAATIDGVSALLFLWGAIYFIKLLTLYCKTEFFSANILTLYRKIIWIGFIWTLYNPLKHTLLSLVTTITNPPGQRILSVCFRSEDLFHIFIVGSFVILNALMHEAYKIKQEQDPGYRFCSSLQAYSKGLKKNRSSNEENPRRYGFNQQTE